MLIEVVSIMISMLTLESEIPDLLMHRSAACGDGVENEASPSDCEDTDASIGRHCDRNRYLLACL